MMILNANMTLNKKRHCSYCDIHTNCKHNTNRMGVAQIKQFFYHKSWIFENYKKKFFLALYPLGTARCAQHLERCGHFRVYGQLRTAVFIGMCACEGPRINSLFAIANALTRALKNTRRYDLKWLPPEIGSVSFSSTCWWDMLSNCKWVTRMTNVWCSFGLFGASQQYIRE